MHTKCQNPAKINKDRCFVAAVWKLNRVGDPSGPKVAALLSVPGFIARGSRTERFASGSSLHRSKCSSEDILQKEQQKIKISFACRKTKGTQCQSTLDPVKTLWLATTRCQTAAHSSTSMTDVCLRVWCCCTQSSERSVQFDQCHSLLECLVYLVQME